MSHSLETKLSIANVRVKAHHGWYAAERKIGGMYTISVSVYSCADIAEDFSEIEDSVNYEEIYAIIKSVMSQEFKLIEHCCKTLWTGVKELSAKDKWEVSLVKEDVPIKHVGHTSFTISG